MTKARPNKRAVILSASQQLAVSKVMQSWRNWQTAQGLSERTITERRYVLSHLVAVTDCELPALTPDDIVRFLSSGTTSRVTKHTYFVAIKAFCAWLVRTGQRDDDPTAKVPAVRRPRAVPRPISTEQLLATLAAATRKRTRMMILLGAFAGLRVHEIAKIRGEDIDRYGRSITVKGKGGSTKILPLHETLAAEIGEWPAFGFWFPNYEDDGQPLRPQAVGVAIQRTMERAGVHGTAHQLRHWYATTLLESGVDIRIVQELLRHESLATTQIYTRVSDSQRRQGLGKLHVPELAPAV